LLSASKKRLDLEEGSGCVWLEDVNGEKFPARVVGKDSLPLLFLNDSERKGESARPSAVRKFDRRCKHVRFSEAQPLPSYSKEKAEAHARKHNDPDSEKRKKAKERLRRLQMPVDADKHAHLVKLLHHRYCHAVGERLRKS